jgi:DMSO/TMAO reductase YedYZ molybdopterin-dependent catalytic subunit
MRSRRLKRFFVRCHIYTPHVDLRTWTRVELFGVLECAGNGRSFYQPRVPRTDVLAKAGVKDSAKHILFDGADEPLGKMDDFRRSITIEKELDADTMLAFEMNGQELPVQHGFPL